MTIQSESSKAGPFDGNDVATSFSFTFKAFAEADLAVIFTSTLSVESPLVLDTDYSVSLNADQEASPGGTITYPIAGSPLATGEKLTALNAVDFLQGLDLQNGGAWNPHSVENALDLLTMLALQNKEELSRAVKVDVSSDTAPDDLLTDIDTAVANSAASASASAASASASAVSASAAADSESAAATSENNADLERQYAAEWANKAEDALVSAAAGGDEVDDYSSLHHANKSSASAADAAASAASATEKNARNCALNQEPVSQGESTETGMESLLGTAASGVTTTGGDYGYLKWYKDHNNVQSHILADSVRGDFYLASDTTAAEAATVPAVTADDVTWTFQTNKKATGVTNRNKAYACHYNADMGFSIVGYEGDGVDGHEIPHHLGVTPELSIFKDRDAANSWIVTSNLLGVDDYLVLNTTSAIQIHSKMNLAEGHAVFLTSSATHNAPGNNHVSYHFASKSGVCKIGAYIGTGAAGNYVSTEVDGGDAFKPAFVMVKRLDSTANWRVWDGIRSSGDESLSPNLTNAGAAVTDLNFVDSGVEFTGTGADLNVLNGEYLFIAFAETNIDANKAWADYSYPTAADTLSIAQDTLISFAEGFNAAGQVDTQENVGAGITYSLGAGHENKHYHIYKDKGGSYGVSEYRPLEGWDSRNDCDKWGEVSPLDAALRTTAKHFDHESETGIVLASADDGANLGYFAFNKDSNDIAASSTWRVASTTASWLQYKQNEKRILKSWRFRSSISVTQDPRRFTIEGSNDGLNWAAIDSSYTASDYVGNGAFLWGDIGDTSANTTAYLYHRINITANNGDATYTQVAEVEFSTVLPSDYYLAQDGKMYNDTDTAIARAYLAEFKTNADGDVINDTLVNYPVGVQRFGDVDVHGDLTVYGDILSDQVLSAGLVFDGTKNPPLPFASVGDTGIVDTGTGSYEIVLPADIDAQTCNIQVSSDAYITRWARSGNRVQIRTHNSGNTLTDYNPISIAVFGGREIK